jgi:hypothetical protein
MTFISSATVKEAFLRYCTHAQNQKKKYVLGQVRLIFTVRGIQNLEGSNGLMVFSTLKMLEQTNDAFGSISFNRFKSNEEKYSLSVTGKKTEDSVFDYSRD